MRPGALLVLPLVAACAPPPASPRAEPTAAPSAASAAPIEHVGPRRSRRGECDLGAALDAFLAGQDAVRCGALGPRSADDDYERARACVLAAERARKAFSVVRDRPGIDSMFREAFAGRLVGGRYEVRAFSYDSCPSGCGDADPTWSSVRCEPLVDLRAACKTRPPREKAPADEELRWFCDEARANERRRVLELHCKGRADPEGCAFSTP